LRGAAEDNPDESLLAALRWLLLRLLDRVRSWGKGSEVLVQPLRSSFDDEQKVARKRTYLTAVVAVVMSASMAQVSIWAAAGLPDRRRE